MTEWRFCRLLAVHCQRLKGSTKFPSFKRWFQKCQYLYHGCLLKFWGQGKGGGGFFELEIQTWGCLWSKFRGHRGVSRGESTRKQTDDTAYYCEQQDARGAWTIMHVFMFIHSRKEIKSGLYNGLWRTLSWWISCQKIICNKCQPISDIYIHKETGLMTSANIVCNIKGK